MIRLASNYFLNVAASLLNSGSQNKLEEANNSHARLRGAYAKLARIRRAILNFRY